MTNRDLYTNHDLHLNGQGKERLANQIVSHILSVLEQSEGPLIVLDHHPKQNEKVHSLEEKCVKHKSSLGVLSTAETDCQKYQHHATQEKTRSDNTTVDVEENVNITEKIDQLLNRIGSQTALERFLQQDRRIFLWET